MSSKYADYSEYTPPWPLPVMAGVQLAFGAGMAFAVREPGGGWDLEYALIGLVLAVPGAVILWFAVRNCRRLWSVQASEASWRTVIAAGVMCILSLVVASGPSSVGDWEWKSLVPAAYAVYLVVVLVREVRRLVSSRPAPATGV